MLDVAVQQKASARLYDAAEIQPLQRISHASQVVLKASPVGRETMVIDRERDAPITEFRQQLDGVQRIVVGQAVGVVAEQHNAMIIRGLLSVVADAELQLELLEGVG